MLILCLFPCSPMKAHMLNQWLMYMLSNSQENIIINISNENYWIEQYLFNRDILVVCKANLLKQTYLNLFIFSTNNFMYKISKFYSNCKQIHVELVLNIPKTPVAWSFIVTLQYPKINILSIENGPHKRTCHLQLRLITHRGCLDRFCGTIFLFFLMLLAFSSAKRYLAHSACNNIMLNRLNQHLEADHRSVSKQLP